MRFMISFFWSNSARLLSLTVIVVASSISGHCHSLKASEIKVKESGFEASVPRIAEDVSNKYKIVIGLYGVISAPGDKNTPYEPVTVPAVEGSLATLLDSIVAHAPGYQWEEDDNGIYLRWGRLKPAILDQPVSNLRAYEAS